MLHTKQDIEKMLVFADDKDEFYFFEKADTKEKRSLAQNAGFHQWIDAICKHTWDEMDDLKQRLLVKLFWNSVKKIWWEDIIVQNKTSTKNMDKEEASKYIDAVNTIWKFLWMWILIKSRDVLNLYDSYNNHE